MFNKLTDPSAFNFRTLARSTQAAVTLAALSILILLTANPSVTILAIVGVLVLTLADVISVLTRDVESNAPVNPKMSYLLISIGVLLLGFSISAHFT